MNKAQMHPVKTNLINGSYRPKFFDLKEFNLSEAKLDSASYSDKNINPELVIIKKDYSFCYLREDKLKLINVFDERGIRIDSEKFLKRFGIEIQSGNLFKTGKYLSRIFRPVRYGGFFHGVDVFIQKGKTIDVTDGISLISLQLAKSLGWEEAEHGSSGQFTLFFKEGLVKGHCIVSDRIKHDVIIYSNDNIKTEIRFNYKDNLSYLSIEPVKLSRSLRLDIQSMLTLWGLFGARQYLLWAKKGIMRYKSNLLSGKLNDWLEDDTADDKWVLKRAINAGLDYRQFPGLFRMAWTMYRNSIMKYAENKRKEPTFRIPAPNGIRAYIRIDIRNHKPDGHFNSQLSEDEIYIDKHGNAFFSEIGFEYKMKVLGGADQDDSIAIIPIKDNKAVIYRNPNQFGEYLILKVRTDKGVIDNKEQPAKLVGSIPTKEINSSQISMEETKYDNPLIEYYLKETPREINNQISYTPLNLLKNYSAVIENTANIGYAANAEMILSAIRITDKPLFNKLKAKHNWDLEKIIDGTIKDGADLKEEMRKVRNFFEEVSEKCPLPKTLRARLPEKMKERIKYSVNHELDYLLEAIKFIIEEADTEILGKGTISGGNRIPGIIDRLETPIESIMSNNKQNPLEMVAMEMLYQYNYGISKIINDDKDVIQSTRELKKQLLEYVNIFNQEDKLKIVEAVATQLYKSNKGIHDSILWIDNIDNLRGISDLTIELFSPKKVNEYTVEEVANDNRVHTDIKNLMIEETPNGMANQLETKEITYDYMDNNYNDNKDMRIINVAERNQGNQYGINNLMATLKSKKGIDKYGKHDNENKCNQIIKLRLWSKEKLNSEGMSSKHIRIEGSKAYMDDMILNVGDEYLGIISNGIYNIIRVMQSRSKRHYGRKLSNSIDVIINT